MAASPKCPILVEVHRRVLEALSGERPGQPYDLSTENPRRDDILSLIEGRLGGWWATWREMSQADRHDLIRQLLFPYRPDAPLLARLEAHATTTHEAARALRDAVAAFGGRCRMSAGSAQYDAAFDSGLPPG